MASHRIATSTSLRPEDPLATYLSDLAAQLCGLQRHRKAILGELRDGLEQATKERIAAGLRPEQAAAAAITEFGTPWAVGDAFRGELATGYARRTIASFVITGPLVGIWWLLLLDPSPWRTGLIALLAAVPIIPLIVIAIATAAGTLATTGRLMRWLPETGPRRALTATTAIALLCILCDLTMITMFVVSGAPTRPSRSSPSPPASPGLSAASAQYDTPTGSESVAQMFDSASGKAGIANERPQYALTRRYQSRSHAQR